MESLTLPFLLLSPHSRWWSTPVIKCRAHVGRGTGSSSESHWLPSLPDSWGGTVQPPQAVLRGGGCFILFYFFEARFCYVAQASLELSIFLPQPPECWDIMCFWEFTVPMDGSRPSMNDSSFLQLCTKQHLIFFTIRKSYFLFSRSGVWTQGLHLELLHKPHFLWRIFFEIGSRELFAWAGLKP
jgi:hypothetical protein